MEIPLTGITQNGSPEQRIGFVGLGQMGEPMARRLAATGVALYLYDVRPEVAERLAAETAATACATAEEVGSASEVVITMLPDGATVAQAVLGGDSGGGIAAGLAQGGIVVDMSSAAPEETRAVGAALAARRIHMVDAPVSGGVDRAQAGTLAVMAGGEAADIGSCMPLFEAMGERTFHTGALGSGHAVKALNNAVSAAGLIAATEALIVGQAAGVDPAVMLKVLNASTGRNNATENKIGQFVFTRSFDSGFALRLMAKDVGIAEALAGDLGIKPELLGDIARIVDDAQGELDRTADHTALVQWLETRAGAPALAA